MTDTSSSDDHCNSAGCCEAVVFDGASPAYRRILLGVIALNIVGFGVVAAGSFVEGSTTLAANALDFLADSATYAISLWAIGKAVFVRSGAALFKAASLGVAAVVVMGLAAARALHGVEPEGSVITSLGLFGAGINLVAGLLLLRYRNGDANVRSVWLCTRNDLIECLAVAVTGGMVWLTDSRWPDVIVGIALAAVFLQSASLIARQARRELHEQHARDETAASQASISQ